MRLIVAIFAFAVQFALIAIASASEPTVVREPWHASCSDRGCSASLFFQTGDDSRSLHGGFFFIRPRGEEYVSRIRVLSPLGSRLLRGVSIGSNGDYLGRIEYSDCKKTGCFAEGEINKGQLFNILRSDSISLTVWNEQDVAHRVAIPTRGLNLALARIGMDVGTDYGSLIVADIPEPDSPVTVEGRAEIVIDRQTVLVCRLRRDRYVVEFSVRDEEIIRKYVSIIEDRAKYLRAAPPIDLARGLNQAMVDASNEARRLFVGQEGVGGVISTSTALSQVLDEAAERNMSCRTHLEASGDGSAGDNLSAKVENAEVRVFGRAGFDMETWPQGVAPNPITSPWTPLAAALIAGPVAVDSGLVVQPKF